MMGMASPTGYLDLEQPAISAAAEVGPSTIDGVAVTQYELAIDPAALASAPGMTSEEAEHDQRSHRGADLAGLSRTFATSCRSMRPDSSVNPRPP